MEKERSREGLKKLGEEGKKPEEKIGEAACFGPDSCDTERVDWRKVPGTLCQVWGCAQSQVASTSPPGDNYEAEPAGLAVSSAGIPTTAVLRVDEDHNIHRTLSFIMYHNGMRFS